MTVAVASDESAAHKRSDIKQSALTTVCLMLGKIFLACLGGFIGVVAGYIIGILTGLIRFSC
jgi:hypothetical protein